MKNNFTNIYLPDWVLIRRPRFFYLLTYLKIDITSAAAFRTVRTLWHCSSGRAVTWRKFIKHWLDRIRFLHWTLPSHVLISYTSPFHLIICTILCLQFKNSSVKCWKKIIPYSENKYFLIFWFSGPLYSLEKLLSAINSMSVNTSSVFHMD